jgi:phage-related minor tail protein
MANGTPSQSFKLGADLLEQMGDLKGAAKALGDEAKDAQKEVREAEKALRDLERRKAKGEKVDTDAAFETLQTKQARAESLRQRQADLKAQDRYSRYQG